MVNVDLRLGDCLEVTKAMPENSIDSVVCDPPYGLSFMGKNWDHGVPGVPFWEAALRIAKPGAHLLAFGGTRTHHRLMVAIEDAGWEIRDCLMWLYGSGMPKGQNISKAIDKAAGAEREAIGQSSTLCPDFPNPCRGHPSANGSLGGGTMRHALPTVPATPEAAQWSGWNTNLKPAWEPIILARKPLSEKTIAANVLEWGTGAINVDGCRIGTERRTSKGMSSLGVMHDDNWRPREVCTDSTGRWPANLLLGEEVAKSHEWSRFFYVAKASKRDRGEGNTHLTCKPTILMRQLCRLVTPPNGTVLDPFCGSGSTGKAAVLEGFSFVGIDIEAAYLDIARRGIAEVQNALMETARL